jgi:hypothetical protein
MKSLVKFKLLIYLFLATTGTMLLQSCAVYNPYNLAVVPVTDIVQMSKDGISSKDIIDKLKDTHSVYLLQADQYAKLNSEGVQDSVINYMEKTKMQAIRRNQQMQDAYYGYPGMYDYGYWGMGFGWPYGYWGWPYGYGGWGFGPTIIFRGGGGYNGGYHGDFHGGYHAGGGFHGGGGFHSGGSRAGRR